MNKPYWQITQYKIETWNELNKEKYKVFVSMNFCYPMPSDTIQEIEKFQPTNIILIPLYPQFSTTTTWSFLEKWKQSYKKSNLLCKQKIVCFWQFSYQWFLYQWFVLSVTTYHSFNNNKDGRFECGCLEYRKTFRNFYV